MHGNAQQVLTTLPSARLDIFGVRLYGMSGKEPRCLISPISPRLGGGALRDEAQASPLSCISHTAIPAHQIPRDGRLSTSFCLWLGRFASSYFAKVDAALFRLFISPQPNATRHGEDARRRRIVTRIKTTPALDSLR